MVEMKHSCFIKSIQIDGGGEFRLLFIFLEKTGVVHRYTYSHTSEQNEVIELRHKYIVEKGLTMLLLAYLPVTY